MKFLLDVGISPRLSKLLTADGHNCRYVPDYYSNKSTDSTILDIAIENNEVVITHDLDFGTLLAFSGKNQPSVILFRIHHIDPLRFYNLITQYWSVIAEPLESGALIIIESDAIRIRQLPISKHKR